MKTKYRGFEIEVTRSKSVAGTSLITGVATVTWTKQRTPMDPQQIRKDLRCGQ